MKSSFIVLSIAPSPSVWVILATSLQGPMGRAHVRVLNIDLADTILDSTLVGILKGISDDIFAISTAGEVVKMTEKGEQIF